MTLLTRDDGEATVQSGVIRRGHPPTAVARASPGRARYRCRRVAPVSRPIHPWCGVRQRRDRRRSAACGAPVRPSRVVSLVAPA
jgi:hypothetical protein